MANALRQLLLESYPAVKELIVNYCRKQSKCESFGKWVTELMDYNLSGGKFTRGQLLLGAYCRNSQIIAFEQKFFYQKFHTCPKNDQKEGRIPLVQGRRFLDSFFYKTIPFGCY